MIHYFRMGLLGTSVDIYMSKIVKLFYLVQNHCVIDIIFRYTILITLICNIKDHFEFFFILKL